MQERGRTHLERGESLRVVVHADAQHRLDRTIGAIPEAVRTASRLGARRLELDITEIDSVSSFSLLSSLVLAYRGALRHNLELRVRAGQSLTAAAIISGLGHVLPLDAEDDLAFEA